MFIHRDNYESVFLLYVDNELSTQERMQVDEFLQANEDLRHELEILRSAILPEDDLLFIPKTSLYKNISPVESVQESLLLLLDNELPETLQGDIDRQIRENPEIGEEWKILQNTCLNAGDKVTFPDKESLYKRKASVIPIKFWRAAAAVLIGLGMLIGISMHEDDGPGESIVQRSIPHVDPILRPATMPIVKPIIEKTDIGRTPAPATKSLHDTKHEPFIAANNKSTNANVKNVQVAVEPLVRTMPKENDRNVAKSEGTFQNETAAVLENEMKVITNNPSSAGASNAPPMADADVSQVKNTFARLALAEEEPDRFLNIEQEQTTRSKLGGILRQVKRVVERKTNIRTANGLRIGGFEIALK